MPQRQPPDSSEIRDVLAGWDEDLFESSSERDPRRSWWMIALGVASVAVGLAIVRQRRRRSAPPSAATA